MCRFTTQLEKRYNYAIKCKTYNTSRLSWLAENLRIDPRPYHINNNNNNAPELTHQIYTGGKHH